CHDFLRLDLRFRCLYLRIGRASSVGFGNTFGNQQLEEALQEFAGLFIRPDPGKVHWFYTYLHHLTQKDE
ncbi:MAG: hypothetical protein WCJ76_12725, partial [Comamonadaceae bacterium]